MRNLKRKPRCTATARSRIGCGDDFVEIGRMGRVLATRGDRILVKWDGRGHGADHPKSEVEIVACGT